MAQSAQARNGSASVQDLEVQIDALKDDIAQIARTLGDLSAAKKNDMRDTVQNRAAALRDRGEATVAEMQSRGMEMGEQAADAVRRQPAAAMGIAVGLGFLVGLMTGRR
ncbi:MULTISPECIES: DUF883 family protein [Rhodovulum]|uniref:ElaB/YqjD/DUF883 family membrane-anchored ribosome-binding protein n=2 Tax=Rhodovulum TaxID=34008 RepID=A0A8E2VKU6_9RHOB|nr:MULTISPECIES: DUF883 family protein [Rhodovulum]PTW50644.1 ElaB/YqjD/DUF883 family membrane-anchored ribosome-binding protein [Rhodovulum kholense]RAP42320.1 hypothetical protein BYZ73_06085 [Rhodovulum viride]